MSGLARKRVLVDEPGLGEVKFGARSRARLTDPSSVLCLGLPRNRFAARPESMFRSFFHEGGRYFSIRCPLRPLFNDQLRTGTDRGNPTV